MSKIDKLVENYFKPQKNKFTVETLLELVEQVVGELPLLTEQSEGAALKDVSIDDILGTLQIDIAKWGNRSKTSEGEAQERKIIQNYVKALGGNTPDQILKNLQLGIEKESSPQLREKLEFRGKCNLSETISKIQLLNTLSTIVNNFDPSATGFIMEGFLSAVFPGGQVVRVKDSLGVEDFVVAGSDGDIHYSLKTKIAGSDFGGSIVDLVKSIEGKGEIIYYIFGKIKSSQSSVGSIEVHKVIINAKNLFTITNVTEEQVALARRIIAKQNERKAAKQSSQEQEQDKVGDELSLEEEKLPRGAGEFKVSKNAYFSDQYKIATLTVDEESLMKVAQVELADMLDQLREVQTNFKKLVYEMNLYFSTMDSWTAEQVKLDSITFNNSTQKNINGDESCSN